MEREGEATDLAEVVGSWVRGWARARGVRPTVLRPGAWHARLDTESRREEVLLAAPTVADLESFAAEYRGDSRAWVTALPPPGGTVDDPPEGLVVLQHAEVMMRRELGDEPAAMRPGLGREHLHGDDAVVQVTYRVDGGQAARGAVAVTDGLAVFDRILTEDAFRRQGYGRDVMAALAVEARAMGAESGLLVASPDGQALYSALGWERVVRVATFAPAADG